MKLYFLGTNGWFDTETGNTVCVLLETKDRYIIFDAGNGIHKIDRYITKNKPVVLLVSHYHIDHVSGFHILAKFNFKQGLDIYGPPGLKEFFNKVINPYSMPISRLSTKVRLHEVSENNQLPAGIRYAKLKHSCVCYGYRVSAEDKVVSFCTDTGICDNLYVLAKKADILITECSFLSGQKNEQWPHLNPESAANVALKLDAKKLVLIHFDASFYHDFMQRRKAGKVSRSIFKNTVVSRDGLKIEI